MTAEHFDVAVVGAGAAGIAAALALRDAVRRAGPRWPGAGEASAEPMPGAIETGPVRRSVERWRWKDPIESADSLRRRRYGGIRTAAHTPARRTSTSNDVTLRACFRGC